MTTHCCPAAGRRIQRGAATDGQAAVAERAGIAQHQAAGIEVDATAEQVRGAQGDDAGVVDRQPAGTGQQPPQAEALGTAQAPHRSPQSNHQ
ncbi:hypothetical protein G6F40_016245 [Rhizopus arrhizus]|nr:hypothetical protein G6F40_016245 [Rhizopus arrhizus]